MSLRNSGSGIAVIHGWHLMLEDLHDDPPHAEPEEFRPQLRDLYVAGDDIGFWQAAFRDPADPEYPGLLEAVRAPRLFSMEVLYSDHEGGQRAIGRFALAPGRRGPVVLLGRQALEPGPARPPGSLSPSDPIPESR